MDKANIKGNGAEAGVDGWAARPCVRLDKEDVARMTRIAAVLRAELGAMVAPFLYFVVAFNAIALTVALIAPDHDMSLVRHGVATVGALLAAKAVLLVDHLPLIDRFPDRPLIWNTFWKGAIYAVVAMLLHVVERLIEAATADGPFADEVGRAFASLDWGRVAAIHLWLAILFLIFAARRELARADGVADLRRLYFGDGAAS
jgi:hypothetical protein